MDELNKVQLSKQHFSVFHTNIRSLSKHHDTLHTQLSMVNIPFDVIGISETKEHIDNEFISNVELRGYAMYSQSSKSFCGGCAIYVNSQLDHEVRNDLSVLEEEYETFWVEINNTKDKNILCCCLYRHPSSDINKFIDHMTSILQKVQKENKTLFIMGDFNINLYNYSSHTETNDFIDDFINLRSLVISSHTRSSSFCFEWVFSCGMHLAYSTFPSIINSFFKTKE